MRRIAAPPWHGGSNDDPLVATGRTLRWGVVATGGIAGRTTSQLARLADAELVAVSSRDAGKAATFARDHGFARGYSDTDAVTGYQHLAADPEVEVVYVATPHGQHHEVTAAMLRAGKHVLVEKAFTINAREARELANLARDRQLFLMEALWTRFLPAFQYALDVIEQGKIGAIRYVQAELGFTAVDDPRSRLWA
ncbi:MAG TPA: Gfo/Idh/MocA family oxidoreductase, partial [Trueperaceae bacterium]|nr:Gfo/Idh/MocA family oxidoreductase [Trueperaceae bacterium]